MIIKRERMITEKMTMRKMIIRTCFLFCYANMTPPLVPAVGSPWSLSSSHPSPIQSQCLRSISLDFKFSILLCNHDKSPIQSQCLRSIFSHFFSIFLCSFEKYPFQIYERTQISKMLTRQSSCDTTWAGVQSARLGVSSARTSVT